MTDSYRESPSAFWALLRPEWPLGVSIFFCNFAAAALEGSSLGLLAVALQMLGSSTASAAATLLGRWGPVLEQGFLSLGRERLFLFLVILAVGAQILKSAFQFLGSIFTATMEARVHARTYNRIFQHILQLPFHRVSSYRLGDLTDYLTQSDRLSNLFLQVNLLIRNGLVVATYLVLLLWLSWQMMFAALLAYGLVSLFLRQIIRSVRDHSGRLTSSNVTLTERTVEFLQAVRLIHTFSRQRQASDEVAAIVSEGTSSRRKASILGATVEPIMDVLTVVGVALFLTGGLTLLGGQDAFRLPRLLAFLLMLYRLTPRIGAIHSSLASLATVRPSIHRITEILSEKPQRRFPQERPFRGFKEGLSFSDVALRYPGSETEAIANLSFSASRGQMVALVGPSGGGKSTVADLLLRLYEPTSGKILVDGQDLNGVSPESWRERLGVVPQETFLFHGTIRQNIAFGRPNATLDEIAAAARAAHAHGFILELANGYETIVGDRGYRLSGGQCQRIALARALIRQPELLILDEATSALDSESERLIQAALTEQRGTRTQVVIAHRLSTVVHADQILVLSQGRLVESGTHESLLKAGGIYARLWKLQASAGPERVAGAEDVQPVTLGSIATKTDRKSTPIEVLKDHPFLEEATFIVGSGRSGTTLMLSLLDGHPDLLVWPEEWEFYLHWSSRLGRKVPPHQTFAGRKLRETFLPHSGYPSFGSVLQPGVGFPVSMASISKERFDEQIAQFDDCPLTRKQFLQAVFLSYYRALGPDAVPSRFVLKLFTPFNALYEDFPDAKVLFCARHPVRAYASLKQFYFMACRDEPWRAYRSGVVPGFSFGVIQVAVRQIRRAYEWFNANQQRPVHVVRLEELQGETEKTMRRLADYLDVPFREQLIQPTVLRSPFPGNLGQGEISSGVVKSAGFTKDLSGFEYRWARAIFSGQGQMAGYLDEPDPRGAQQTALVPAWTQPLRHELLPLQRLWRSRGLPQRSRALVHSMAAMRQYLLNRLYMLSVLFFRKR